MRGSRRLLGFVVRAVVLLAVESLLLVGLTALLPGVEALSFGAALLVAVALALINAVLWPFVTRLALPLTILTFGLASLVLSAGAVALAFYVVDGKSPPFWGNMAIAFGLALVSTFVAPLLDVDGDAYHLRVVRRRSTAHTPAQSHRRPGGDPVRDRRAGRGRSA